MFSTSAYNPATKSFNEAVTSVDLPINCESHVRIEAVGRYVMIFFNNTLSSMKGIDKEIDRIYGHATAMISDPWYYAAKASVSSIRMSSLKTIPPKNLKGIPPQRQSANSLFDDCSPEFGADAGCGHNLQCNAFSDGRSSCGPVETAAIYFKTLPRALTTKEELDSLIVSEQHQTCGKSSRYNNTCAQTDKEVGKLTCTEVHAVVKGTESKKWICLNDKHLKDLKSQKKEKRAVSPRTFCYSDCSYSFGQKWSASL